jgi:hypothetical protein
MMNATHTPDTTITHVINAVGMTCVILIAVVFTVLITLAF